MKYYTKEWLKSGWHHIDINDKYYKKSEEVFGVDLDIHDCKIISDTPKEMRGEYFEIQFNNKYGFTRFSKIKFYDYEILDSCEIKGMWCLVDEIYQYYDGRFEYHLLLEPTLVSDNHFADYFTVNCSKIEIE